MITISIHRSTLLGVTLGFIFGIMVKGRQSKANKNINNNVDSTSTI